MLWIFADVVGGRGTLTIEYYFGGSECLHDVFEVLYGPSALLGVKGYYNGEGSCPWLLGCITDRCRSPSCSGVVVVVGALLVLLGPRLGTADAEIKVLSAERLELSQVLTYEAWSRNVAQHTFACCREVCLSYILPSLFIRNLFSFKFVSDIQ